jgi:hypothetical protein
MGETYEAGTSASSSERPEGTCGMIGVMSMGPDRPPALGDDFWRFTSVVRFGIMKSA